MIVNSILPIMIYLPSAVLYEVIDDDGDGDDSRAVVSKFLTLCSCIVHFHTVSGHARFRYSEYDNEHFELWYRMTFKAVRRLLGISLDRNPAFRIRASIQSCLVHPCSSAT